MELKSLLNIYISKNINNIILKYFTDYKNNDYIDYLKEDNYLILKELKFNCDALDNLNDCNISNINIIHLLLSKDVSINKLIYICNLNYLEIVKLLTKKNHQKIQIIY